MRPGPGVPATDAPPERAGSRPAPGGPRRAAPVVAVQPPLVRGRNSRLWQGLLVTVGVVVLLAVCGLSTLFIVKDEQAGRGALANGKSPMPSVLPRDISSREVDNAPLTAAEVFPTQEIVIVPGQPAYQVLRTQETADCRIAATGELAKQLTDAGCSQVVRATMRSPTGEYLVTGGIFNLADQAGADRVYDAIRPVIDANKGRFSGLVAGNDTKAIVLSSTHLGWQVRGHYLVYCVIARSDGKEFQPGDPYANQIIYDIMTLHLRNTVLEKRATIPVSPSGGENPAGAPTEAASG